MAQCVSAMLIFKKIKNGAPYYETPFYLNELGKRLQRYTAFKNRQFAEIIHFVARQFSIGNRHNQIDKL